MYNKSQGRFPKFSLFSPSLISGITIRTGSNGNWCQASVIRYFLFLPLIIISLHFFSTCSTRINLGSHLQNSIMFMYFNKIRLLFLTSSFPLSKQKSLAWLRHFECQAFLGFPPPSSPPEKMVNVTLGNNRTVKNSWCFLYAGVCWIPYT
jgi:hypothetical protein